MRCVASCPLLLATSSVKDMPHPSVSAGRSLEASAESAQDKPERPYALKCRGNRQLSTLAQPKVSLSLHAISVCHNWCVALRRWPVWLLW